MSRCCTSAATSFSQHRPLRNRLSRQHHGSGRRQKGCHLRNRQFPSRPLLLGERRVGSSLLSAGDHGRPTDRASHSARAGLPSDTRFANSSQLFAKSSGNSNRAMQLRPAFSHGAAPAGPGRGVAKLLTTPPRAPALRPPAVNHSPALSPRSLVQRAESAPRSARRPRRPALHHPRTKSLVANSAKRRGPPPGPKNDESPDRFRSRPPVNHLALAVRPGPCLAPHVGGWWYYCGWSARP